MPLSESQAQTKLAQFGAVYRQRQTVEGRTVDWYWSASHKMWIAKTYVPGGVELRKAPGGCGCT